MIDFSPINRIYFGSIEDLNNIKREVNAPYDPYLPRVPQERNEENIRINLLFNTYIDSAESDNSEILHQKFENYYRRHKLAEKLEEPALRRTFIDCFNTAHSPPPDTLDNLLARVRNFLQQRLDSLNE